MPVLIPTKRRTKIAGSNHFRSRKTSIFSHLCQAIQQGKFIPIIGDTIRISHIFDVDMNEDIGIDGELENQDGDVTFAAEDDEQQYRLNVIEELAYHWAESINYPLSDRYRISRVAQFQALRQENATQAKQDYLSFLKDTLLDVAEDLAVNEDDQEGVELVSHLRYDTTRLFAEMVRELDFPHFPVGKEDPMRLLARLPLKIYVTTSYHNFIEQALIAEDKHPCSRLCFWNMDSESVAVEHRIDDEFEPNVANPVVYHLLGMEQYPASLVLTEEDYLDFLWKLAQDLPGDSAERIIPPYLAAELKLSSLLLLGYRLQDWDFRVLFRGLINGLPDAKRTRSISVALQIDLKEQPLVEDEEKAKQYLKSYFKESRFQVKFGDSDDFVLKLWRAWQDMNPGGKG